MYFGDFDVFPRIFGESSKDVGDFPKISGDSPLSLKDLWRPGWTALLLRSVSIPGTRPRPLLSSLWRRNSRRNSVCQKWSSALTEACHRTTTGSTTVSENALSLPSSRSRNLKGTCRTGPHRRQDGN